MSNVSHLQLEKHFFSKIVLEAQTIALPSNQQNITCQIEVGQDQNESRRFQVILRTHLLNQGETKAAYLGEIHIVGLFRVSENYPQEKVNSLVQINGATLLYGAVREMVMNLTSRGPWPMLTLGTMNFQTALEAAPSKAETIS